MTQQLQPGTYEMLFIFAGLAWIGLSLIATALYIGCRSIFRATPKPTSWEREWSKIERDISR